MPDLTPPGTEDLLGLGKAAEKLIESASAFLKTLFGPLTQEAGQFLADPLRDYREARRKRIAQLVVDTEEAVRRRGGTATAVPPRLLIPLLEKASLETDEVLRRKWVNLLSEAADSRTQHAVHASFPTVLEQLGSEDVVILDALYRGVIDPLIEFDDIPPMDDAWIANQDHEGPGLGEKKARARPETLVLRSMSRKEAQRISRLTDRDFRKILGNLYRLYLIDPAPQAENHYEEFALTDFGLAFVSSCHEISLTARYPDSELL